MLAQTAMSVVFVIEETITLCTEKPSVTAEKEALEVLSIYKSATETSSLSNK